MAQLSNELRNRAVETVLDIGANQGQFASALFSVGYSGLIVSFEPLQSAHDNLVAISRQHATWIIAPRCAVGSANGTVQINVSQNLVSSSILPILKSHTDAAAGSVYVGAETVPIITLDEYLSENPVHRPFLKVDTQGYEKQVLLGAKTLCKELVGLQLEISLVDLYEGQPVFLDLLGYVREMGFQIWSIDPGFRDPKSGRLLQFDALFFK